MIKLILCGCSGQMGKVIIDQVNEMDNFKIVAGMDRSEEQNYDFPVFNDINDFDGEADAIIDFSNPSTLPKLLKYSTEKNVPLVVASTGYSYEEIKNIEEASKKVAILYSGNMSLGINVLLSLVKKAASALEGFDIEVIEKHHNKKVDSPSGTAYMIASAINEEFNNEKEFVYGRYGNDTKRQPKEIGIHAVRGGSIVGEHSVIFAGIDEIVEIKHTAMSKKIFAVGSINAAKFIADKEPRLYSMDDLFKEV
ncbi:dihydrodipicolinate reductase DapB [Gottschalkia acidurici 9a]|uniref:4-hydroxy-tetrahydrodipicolinate reductase n=1 Tax=Gottschalkia acidurici (strain ATCC 7906 / DSM 604 / BCRC 14475 / CIP 104303 / KCTC 5404 / NCIMB 10678 / 9a) TaxID=1128398 RepID=K0B0L8_GOTA9|nr:4-hydroxy-tetrahydrodipicolinate reductase [Gottschalkia acidurici]AFS78191.1 dihydrodipicolinate reductase DapB [Gottschalkia acidurici 9a]